MASPLPTRPLAVLVVDDHRPFARALVASLRALAWVEVVGVAATVGEGLELARRARPRVVLMDVSLPDGTGLDATRRLRAELPDVAVVILSMRDGDAWRRVALEAGAAAFVGKSQLPTELEPVLRSLAAADVRSPQPA